MEGIEFDTRLIQLNDWLYEQVDKLQPTYTDLIPYIPTDYVNMFGMVIRPGGLISCFLKEMVVRIPWRTRKDIVCGAIFYTFEVMARGAYLDRSTFGTMFLGALMVCMKIECDIPYNNVSFAHMLQWKLPIMTVADIEHMFLGASMIMESVFSPEPPRDADAAAAWWKKQRDNPFPIYYRDDDYYKLVRSRVESLLEGIEIA